MRMNAEQRAAHERYEHAQTANPVFAKAVDEAFRAVRDAIAGRGMDTAGDDRAEALVAAIVIYIEESAE